MPIPPARLQSPPTGSGHREWEVMKVCECARAHLNGLLRGPTGEWHPALLRVDRRLREEEACPGWRSWW